MQATCIFTWKACIAHLSWEDGCSGYEVDESGDDVEDDDDVHGDGDDYGPLLVVLCCWFRYRLIL